MAHPLFCGPKNAVPRSFYGCDDVRMVSEPLALQPVLREPVVQRFLYGRGCFKKVLHNQRYARCGFERPHALLDVFSDPYFERAAPFRLYRVYVCHESAILSHNFFVK